MRITRENKSIDKIQQLADYIDHCHAMVAITGAGMDFKSGSEYPGKNVMMYLKSWQI